MKIKTKFSILSSAAVLATSPLAFANEGASEVVPVMNPADSECFVGVDPGVAPTPTVVLNEDIDKGELTDEVATPEAPVADSKPEAGDVVASEPVDQVADEGTAVPIDWVKRGGDDNPDVMFYSMAGGGTPVLKGETSSVAKEVGQNEQGAAIETKEMGAVPLIHREKKGPVALLNKGRVFLR